VLGITEAVAGVTPEKLEHSLNDVTEGLALAFDTTALALGLTMVVMFLCFLTERMEHTTLEEVDRFVDRHLAHRFERTDAAGGEYVEALRRNSDILLQAMEQLVVQQAEVWGKAVEAADRRRAEAEQHLQDRLGAALEAVLEKTLDAHAKRLAALEKHSGGQAGVLLEKVAGLAAAVRDTGREQHATLAKVADGLAAQAQALTGLQQGEKQLLQLQETLGQNLEALAGAGSFEKAVHSLTAAIHLMTLHAGPRRPGAAA
jgi:hypothetical protein